MKYRDSPTKRSLALLRRRGYLVAIGEKWNPFAKIRQDIYGFGDLLACKAVTGLILPDVVASAGRIENKMDHFGGIFLVQCTSGPHHASRKTKIMALPSAKMWCDSGGGILLMSWTKRGERGKRKLWACREEWIDPSFSI